MRLASLTLSLLLVGLSVVGMVSCSGCSDSKTPSECQTHCTKLKTCNPANFDEPGCQAVCTEGYKNVQNWTNYLSCLSSNVCDGNQWLVCINQVSVSCAANAELDDVLNSYCAKVFNCQGTQYSEADVAKCNSDIRTTFQNDPNYKWVFCFTGSGYEKFLDCYKGATCEALGPMLNQCLYSILF